MSGLETVAERLQDVGLSPKRFIDVVDGEKKSVDHEAQLPTQVSGNWGLYATGSDALVILDIDDYHDLEDKSGHAALGRLPDTFEQRSPHGGTHRLYAVEPTDDGRLVAAALSDAFGNPNLKASWGEVRTDNQYVVGAGSQLHGCGKDWCSDCADPDGGHYAVAADREIAELDAEQLIDVLSADPELSKETEPDRQNLKDFDTDHATDDADVSVFDVLSRAYDTDNRHEHPVHGSTTGTNFMVDEDGETWRCWRHSCTGNALHLVGMEEGLIDCGDWQGTGLDSETWAEIFDAARDRGLDVGDPPDGIEYGSAPTEEDDLDEDEVERGEAILAAQRGVTDPFGDLVHQNGHYGYNFERKDSQGNPYTEFVSVCNFTLSLEHVIETYEGKLMSIRVHPASPMEDPYTVQVHPTVFNSARTFNEEVVRGRTTHFQPQKNADETLKNLRLTVGHQPAPQHEGTEYIGLHGDGYDEWVTPAGTLTADGWAEQPTHKYYEKGGSEDMESSLVEKWTLNPDAGADYDADIVRAILERVPEIRQPDRGLPILGWWYAAPLKPIIHDIEGEFNLLQVTGDTEAGKTSTLQLFYQLFGADEAPFGCGDTNFTIEKKFASSCGLPIWLDEYKPTDLSERKLNWLHRRLRELTREKSVSKGQQDLGEITFKMRAPAVFSGEQTVTEAAVRRRTVMTHLTDQATTGAQQEAFCELSGASYTDAEGNERYPAGYDLHEHALAFYQHVLSKDVAELREAWQAAREKTREHLRALDVPDLDGSEFQGLQTIVYGVGIYRQFADAMDVPESAQPDDVAVRRALQHVLSNIGPEGRRREHIDEFVELLDQAAAAGYLEEGAHHRVYQPQLTDGDALAFHMPSAFSAVKKFVREYNIEEEYSLLGKNDYLDSFRDKAEQGESYPLKVNHRVRGIDNGSKAVVIDPHRAATVLPDGFNLSAFTEVADERDATGSGGDDPDGFGGAITDFDALEPGYRTIECELASLVDPAPWLQDEGTLSDGQQKVDVVARGDENVLAPAEQGDRIRIVDAKIGRDEDGLLQVELRDGTTEVKVIESTQTPIEDHEQEEEAAADGGTTQLDSQTEEIDEAILQWIDAQHGEQGAPAERVVPAVAGDLDVGPDTVEHRLEQLKQRGDVYEPAENRLRRS
jgi:hypothetical protein